MTPHITKEEEKAFKLSKYADYALEHAAVTKSDEITFNPSIIYVGTGGTINVTDTKGTTLEYTVPSGGRLPVLCIQVKTGGTAAAINRAW